jgi:hypothetical protein
MDPDALRADLRTEYYAILSVITDYDQRLVVVKGWSVTLSLAALGLGFQQGHYALFGLGALTAAGFWFIEALYKRFQMGYYSRMRDIEVAAYHLNAVEVPELGELSSPRIDMYWSFKGSADAQPDPRVVDPGAPAPPPAPGDWRHLPPWRRNPYELHWLLRRAWWLPQVALPHVVAVVLGTVLFVAALLGVEGLDDLTP